MDFEKDLLSYMMRAAFHNLCPEEHWFLMMLMQLQDKSIWEEPYSTPRHEIQVSLCYIIYSEKFWRKELNSFFKFSLTHTYLTNLYSADGTVFCERPIGEMLRWSLGYFLLGQACDYFSYNSLLFVLTIVTLQDSVFVFLFYIFIGV